MAPTATALIVAGGGPVAAGIFVLAASFCFVAAALLVLVRRSLLWAIPMSGAFGATLLALVRDAGGITTLREDAIAVSLLSAAGAIFGVAPVAYARWVRRVFQDAERRLGAQR
jgi:hypothetical protein